MGLGKTAEFFDTIRVSEEGEETRNIAVCAKSIDFREQTLEVCFSEFPCQIRPITFSRNLGYQKDRATRRQLVSQRDSKRLLDQRRIGRKCKRIIVILLLLRACRF